MTSAPDPEPHHHILHRRMKDSFTPIYQIVLSIIQGVALTDLVVIVAERYPEFTIVQWLLAFLSFGILIYNLNVYLIMSTIWDWIPDWRDASIPFMVGALEIFLNHSIALSLSAWMVGLAAITIVGAMGTWYMDSRAKEEMENARLLKDLRSHHLLFALYYGGGAAFLLLLALVSYLAGIEASEGIQGMKTVLALGMVILVGIALSGALVLSNLYWQKALTYARTGEVPVRRKTRQSNKQPQNHS